MGAIKPALTPDQAKAAGYTSWSEHLPTVPCPAGRGGYCATCMAPMAQPASR